MEDAASQPGRPALSASQKKKIRVLLDKLQAQEPMVFELGTPQIEETEEVNQLVALGPKAFFYLLELLKAEPPKTAAYLALVLGKLKDRRALEPLREFRADYQARKSKAEWEYAAIGQANLAIAALEQP
jgi:hypothetical protein